MKSPFWRQQIDFESGQDNNSKQKECVENNLSIVAQFGWSFMRKLQAEYLHAVKRGVTIGKHARM